MSNEDYRVREIEGDLAITPIRGEADSPPVEPTTVA
jgi:hypothetical protein